MLYFSTNTSSIIQFNLANAGREMGRSMQRLSSGLRINSAADDVAGLAISLSMGARLKSENQSILNDNDALSLAQTADGGLAETTNIIQKLRSLAVQAANGTLTLADRQALQAENDQLVSQVSQIGKSTRFNGIPLLDGSTTGVSIRTGPEAGDTISIPLGSAEAENLGPKGAITIHSTQIAAASLHPDGTPLTINGQAIAVGDSSAATLAAGINAAGIGGLSATAQATSINLGGYSADPAQGYSLPAGALSINGVAIDGSNWVYPTTTITSVLNPDGTTTTTTTHAGTSFGQAITDQINALCPGIAASYSGGQLVLSAADGSNIEAKTAGNNGGNGTFSNLDLTHGSTGTTAIGGLQLSTTSPINISQGLSIAAGQGRDLPSGSYPLSLASAGTLLTQQRAEDFIPVIDTSLRQILQLRTQIGPAENVLGYTISAAQNAADNLEISRSRIVDTDVASESASLVRSQILQQAGIALLAQMNQAPKSMLSLLQSTFGG